MMNTLDLDNRRMAVIDSQNKNLHSTAYQDQLTKKIKRSADLLSSQDEEVQLIPKKRRIEIKHDESVLEFLRDDAFIIGMQANNYRNYEYCQEMNIEIVPEEKKLCKLKKCHTKAIENAEKKGASLGKQLRDLYQLLPKAHICYTSQQIIIDFASKIISQVHDQIKGGDDVESLDENFLKMAENFLSKLPIPFTNEHVVKLAAKLQNEMNCDKTDSSDEDDLDLATLRLGSLLLLLQKDIEGALECASMLNLEQALDQLDINANTIIALSQSKILQISHIHQRTAIQDSNEALFHQMSLKMADLLILDNGNFNFGLLDILSVNLIPKEFQDLLAIENLRSVMADLSTNSAMWDEIASIEAPDNENNPSSFSIRATLNLPLNEPITKRQAQIYVLSALLGHYRQANVGSCFATAFLIKALFYHPEIFIQDLKQLTSDGKVSRIINREYRHFPYFNRVSKEFLATLVEVDSDGFLLSSKFDHQKIKRKPEPITLSNSYIYEAPGIIASCQALGFTDIKDQVIKSLEKLPKKFTIDELLKTLAHQAFYIQESSRYHLRSKKFFSEQELIERAQFAFGIQTNHPLHRAYEQSAASMVDYFGTQYAFPSFIHGTLSEVLDKVDKGLSPKLQSMFRSLKAEIFLPLIIRMRFRYNPHIDDVYKLFDENIHEMDLDNYYGYELCDGGLPKDFSYSKDLYNQYQQHSSMISLQRFDEYPEESSWKVINSEEKFQNFIQDAVKETVKYLKINEKVEIKKLWDEVSSLMCKVIESKNFGKQMTLSLLGRGSDQKKLWNKNPHSMQTRPWSFRWGGDFDAVMRAFFGFSTEPSKLKPFIGSQKEVLAKCINFIKNQPDELRDDLCNNQNLLMITSPVHAFLLKPDESTFLDAIQSNQSTNEYIQINVEKPGFLIANSRLNIRGYKEIIDFIAKNQWFGRMSEKHDFIRQKLTPHSKQVFDQLINENQDLFSMTHEAFKTKLVVIVAKARASDPKIGSRNTVWENQFASALNNFFKTLSLDDQMEKLISKNVAKKILDFARNQEDSVALSENAVAIFLKNAANIPYGLSIKDFRKAIVNAACLAKEEDIHLKSNQWKSDLAVQIDNRLFEMLDEKQQQHLIDSAIITHDPNWKQGVHDFRLGFMVNPGSGNLELFRFLPDLKTVSFFDQKEWFPIGKSHAHWQFPDNYRTYKTGPLFNVNKYM